MGRALATWFLAFAAFVAGSVAVATLGGDAYASEGRVFQHNPVRTAEATMEAFAVAPTSNALTSPTVAVRSMYVDPSCGCLRFVSAAMPNAAGAYDYAPYDSSNPDPFAEVSAYYHATRAIAYLSDVTNLSDEVLGSLSIFVNGQVEIASNGARRYEPLSNALFGYTPSESLERAGVRGPVLLLGRGAHRNFAYDGDIITHEVTHWFVARTMGLQGVRRDAWGTTRSPVALNEGLADYFAAVLGNDATIGEYAAGESASGELGLRSIAGTYVCRPTGEAHRDGIAIASALWEVRTSLHVKDARAFDHAIGQTMVSHQGYSTLTASEFAEALATQLTGAPTIDALRRALATRGLDQACERFVRPDETGSVFMPADAQGTSEVQLEAPLDSLRAATFRVFDQTGFAEAPTLLVRFDRPIEWTTQDSTPTAAFDIRRSLVLASSRSHYEATLQVPNGAKVLYAQLEHEGENRNSVRVVLLPERDSDPNVSPSNGDSFSRNERSPAGCSYSPSSASGALGFSAIFLMALRRARLRREDAQLRCAARRNSRLQSCSH